MRKRRLITLIAGSASWGIGFAANAAQPVFVTPVNAPLLPNLLYEVDYAVSSGPQTQSRYDTIVTLSLPAKNSAANGCSLQVRWFDWNGAAAGLSGGFLLPPGPSMEFTSSVNSALPGEYVPFIENVFRSTKIAFEGYAQVYTNCPVTTKLRIDAEFVTLTVPAAGGPAAFEYKPINVTRPTGAVGY
jgi:hypothetical protein